MKKLLLFLSLALLFSCKKKEVQTECERNRTAVISVSNVSSNPYDIYVSGVLKNRISPNTILEFDISEGNNVLLKVKQVSGYILYATEVEKTFNVVRCSKYSWQIP